jgi:hypothetical protein
MMTGRRLRAGAHEARVVGRPMPRPHRIANALVVIAAGTAAAYLFTRGAWLPGASTSAWGFTALAAGPLICWALLLRWPHLTPVRLIEAFWMVPTLPVAHGLMGPLVDAMGSRLWDGRLARLDLELFGAHPAVELGLRSSPWLNEISMISYYTYFLWPLILGIVLYASRRYAEFGQYCVGLVIFFILNYVGYTLVPAIGPRFAMASVFDGPIQGVWIAPVLEGAMRLPPFMRDCFPSGHTGGTLVVLIFAFLFERRVFAVMLLPATTLILATLLGRFHYAIDLVAALPLVLLAVGLPRLVVRLDPARRVRRVRPRRLPAPAPLRGRTPQPA